MSQRGEGRKSGASALRGDDPGEDGFGKRSQVLGWKEYPGSGGKPLGLSLPGSFRASVWCPQWSILDPAGQVTSPLLPARSQVASTAPWGAGCLLEPPVRYVCPGDEEGPVREEV